MKKLLVTILLIATVLSGCSNMDAGTDINGGEDMDDSLQTENGFSNDSIESMELDVRFRSNIEVRYWPGTFASDRANQTGGGVYTDDIIPDKETAMTVATAVFRGMRGSEHRENYVIIGVAFDEQGDIWIVIFQEERLFIEGAFGGDISIALSQSTGEVLEILFA